MEIVRFEPKIRSSSAVVYGSMVYLSGQVGDPDGDISEQTASALAKIDRLLESAGTDKSRLLTATIWISDIDYFEPMNAVWNAWFHAGKPPARATCVAQPAVLKYKVEIIVSAAIGLERSPK